MKVLRCERSKGILIEVVEPTDISEWTINNEQWTIYPNPTNGRLRIKNYELKEIESVELYDIVGKRQEIIVNCQLSTVNSIDISHLANGLYFLKVDGKMYKIIKN